MFIFMRMACREGRQDSHCQSVLIKTADVISIFSPSRVLMTREKTLYPIKTMRGEPPRHRKYFYIYTSKEPMHIQNTHLYFHLHMPMLQWYRKFAEPINCVGSIKIWIRWLEKWRITVRKLIGVMTVDSSSNPCHGHHQLAGCISK